MTDIHTHTKFSSDSQEEPERLINFALTKQVKALGFSEHLDLDYKALGIPLPRTLDIDAYVKSTDALKEKYKDRIKLLCGVEFAYLKDAGKDYSETDKKYQFDYIINSVHITDGEETYFRGYFEGKNQKTAYKRYLETVLESVYAPYDYQIIGHLGYVSRNAPYKDPLLKYGDYKKETDAIFKAIIEKQKVLEINTSSHTAGTPFLPSLELLKVYYSMGGRLITFGSDCHTVNRLCDKYGDVKKAAKEAGFKEFVYFENKKMETIEI